MSAMPHRWATRVMPSHNYVATTFLNVDLDIYSRSDLQPLLAALSQKTLVLHAGRYGRSHSAHLELARSPKTANEAIRIFAGLISGLPKRERRLWDMATARDFNIGVQAATQPHSYEIRLAHDTVKTVSALKARIVVTVYGAEVASTEKPRVRKTARKSNSAESDPTTSLEEYPLSPNSRRYL